MHFALILAVAVVLGKSTKIANELCKWDVSQSQTGDNIKSTIAAVLALGETDDSYEITLIDEEHSENLIVQNDYYTVLKLSGRDTNGGTLTQTLYKAVASKTENLEYAIDIHRGNATIENIDFQFVEDYDKVTPSVALINVYNAEKDNFYTGYRRPNITIIHCNFKGLGVDSSASRRIINVQWAQYNLFDGCTFTDVKGLAIYIGELFGVIVKNCLFQDISGSNAIYLADNTFASKINITDNKFIRVSGNGYGTIKLPVQGSSFSFSTFFKRNIIDSCSNTRTGGIYLLFDGYSYLEFEDNSFINNEFTSTNEGESRGADAVIWWRYSGTGGLPTGEFFLQSRFAGSASDKVNSVAFDLQKTGTGGQSVTGHISLGAFCTSGTPAAPLPEGCRCLPDDTEQQCSCQINDTRESCKCLAVGDNREHCVDSIPCESATSDQLIGVSSDVCECLAVGDLRDTTCPASVQCDNASPNQLQGASKDICPCLPVGDPRVLVCTSTIKCSNARPTELSGVPPDFCPCLVAGDPRTTLCTNSKQCSEATKVELLGLNTAICPCVPIGDPRTTACQGRTIGCGSATSAQLVEVSTDLCPCRDKNDPRTEACTPQTVDCTKTPTDPSCPPQTVDCTQTPQDPSCQTPAVDCTTNPSDAACSGECSDNTDKTVTQCQCVINDERDVCQEDYCNTITKETPIDACPCPTDKTFLKKDVRYFKEGPCASGTVRAVLSIVLVGILLPGLALFQ